MESLKKKNINKNKATLTLSLQKWPSYPLAKRASYVLSPLTKKLIQQSRLSIQQLLPQQIFSPQLLNLKNTTQNQENYILYLQEKRRLSMVHILESMWIQNKRGINKTISHKLKRSKSQKKVIISKGPEAYQTIDYSENESKNANYKANKTIKEKKVDQRPTDYDSNKSRNTNRQRKVISRIYSNKYNSPKKKIKYNISSNNENSRQCSMIRNRLLKLMSQWNRYEEKIHISTKKGSLNSRKIELQHAQLKQIFIKQTNQLEKKLQTICSYRKVK